MKLTNISKAFGEKVLFSGLTYDIPEGITAVKGASGSGKTTLLRMIAGLEKADIGEVSGKGKISFCFQEPRLFPWLSAKDNAAVAEKEKGLSEKLLRELGLGDDLDLMPSELSGGMQKRVSLARALSASFDTLLLDEPFAGLDADAAENAMRVVRKYTGGKCVLIVSHDEDTVNSADRVIEL